MDGIVKHSNAVRSFIPVYFMDLCRPRASFMSPFLVDIAIVDSLVPKVHQVNLHSPFSTCIFGSPPSWSPSPVVFSFFTV